MIAITKIDITEKVLKKALNKPFLNNYHETIKAGTEFYFEKVYNIYGSDRCFNAELPTMYHLPVELCTIVGV